MDVKLVSYKQEVEEMIRLIIEFWKEHNSITLTQEDALSDLKEWSKEGNKLYIINYENQNVGFVNLGSRGC